MALPNHKMYNKMSTRQEKTVNVDIELNRLEDSVRKLKIDFDIFFAGAVKRPPLEARARLEAQFQRMNDNRKLTYAQRFQLNSLISRFTSYRELWRRNLKARGDEIY